MNINNPEVSFSSIVKIGDSVSQRERETGDRYLSLHRGVMDVTTLDLSSIDIDLNSRSIQQYSSTVGMDSLIDVVRKFFTIMDHHIVITPGGMSSLDIVINSLSDDLFWVPDFHWGSWNKVLKVHGKNINTFDDHHINEFRPTSGVVMICYPSNPSGWIPDIKDIIEFLDHCYESGVTVIIDLPYYNLFFDGGICDYGDNVIVVSSFSKSIGLSGFRIGFVATKNSELYEVLRTRSLYKYNSISNLPQFVIGELLSTDSGIESYKEYRRITISHIKKNIEYLSKRGLLWDGYPSTPIGPFCIINIDHDTLMSNKISSVPLDKFTLGRLEYTNLSRISVAVPSSHFFMYFDELTRNEEKLTKK